MKTIGFLAVLVPLLLGGASAHATPGQPAAWPLGDAQLQQRVPGAHIAQRLDADLNGDGRIDTVLSLAYADTPDQDAYRSVEVLWAHHESKPVSDDDDEDGGSGYVNLKSSPLGNPTLSFKRGVLAVEDLTGGTMATQATYRYRYEADADDMRLIGLDAERYDRGPTPQSSIRLSWNLLTGARVVQRGRANPHPEKDDAALVYEPEVRTVERGVWYYMPNTPDPDELLDAEIGAGAARN